MNPGSREQPAPDLDLRAEAISICRLTKPIGDTLFLSTVAHEIRKRNPRTEITVHSHWPDLFLNNPDIARTFPIREPHVPEAHPIHYEHPWPPPEGTHVLRRVCESVGIPGEEVQPAIYYHPTEAERELAREVLPPADRPLVVVHPFSGFFAARTKQWHFSNWKRFLDLIPEDIETLRFCNPDEPATPTERSSHRDIQTTEIRHTAAYLERADAFIGQESGLAHLATALQVPAVVIFTGYVPSSMFGYPQNINLEPLDLPYAPCWQGDGCPPCEGEICTQSVSPERALEALMEILDRKR